MNEKEVIKFWKQGLSKNRIAEMYKREYNQQIKFIRLELVNRHFGRFISTNEALAVVEKVIYIYLKEKRYEEWE